MDAKESPNQDAYRQALAMKRNDRAAFDAANGTQEDWDRFLLVFAKLAGAK